MAGAGGKRKGWRRLKRVRVKTWWLLVALVPLLFALVSLLRLNHILMTEMRDAVLLADEAEDDEAIVEGLMRLRKFVSTEVVVNVVEENGVQRVEFGTGAFYLEHQYLRAANQALEEAEKGLASDANPHGNIYGEAGKICKPLAIQNGWAWNNANYINCMMTEINKYPAADELQDQIKAVLPSTELYRHNYASRIWAPTPTGWVMLVTLLVVVVIFIRMLIWIVLRLSLLFL